MLDDVFVGLRAMAVGMSGSDFVERSRRTCRGPERGRGEHENTDLQHSRHLLTSIFARRTEERA
ncbi:hypothetical protein VQ02_12510 [Methylobacterium variabile]|uniref:Uncharacterized protein n=2 Tax=Methylobacterium TaxID=407 RepID=A0A0J6SVM7_9HYPH|nr:hypothetical protein VQ02_12510 [Methylobacterium variabile]KMO41343.1 hypothetical protein VP06_01130 [Methylobacterium aquaticum]